MVFFLCTRTLSHLEGDCSSTVFNSSKTHLPIYNTRALSSMSPAPLRFSCVKSGRDNVMATMKYQQNNQVDKGQFFFFPGCLVCLACILMRSWRDHRHYLLMGVRQHAGLGARIFPLTNRDMIVRNQCVPRHVPSLWLFSYQII